MAWIKSHQEIARHPKTRRLARALDITIPQAVGHLHLFWWWALDFADQGDLAGFDANDMADGAMWEGDPHALVDALVDAGYLDRTSEGGCRIHDWYEYMGKLLEQREQAKDRVRKSREKRYADVTRNKRERYADVTQVLRGKSESKIKSREESLSIESGSEGESSPPPAKRAPPKRKTVIPATFALTADMRDWAAENCPGLDVQVHTTKFRNHYKSSERREGDWRAKWENWMLDDYEKAKGSTHYGSPNGRAETKSGKIIRRGHDLYALPAAEEDHIPRLPGPRSDTV